MDHVLGLAQAYIRRSIIGNDWLSCPTVPLQGTWGSLGFRGDGGLQPGAEGAGGFSVLCCHCGHSRAFKVAPKAGGTTPRRWGRSGEATEISQSIWRSDVVLCLLGFPMTKNSYLWPCGGGIEAISVVEMVTSSISTGRKYSCCGDGGPGAGRVWDSVRVKDREAIHCALCFELL